MGCIMNRLNMYYHLNKKLSKPIEELIKIAEEEQKTKVQTFSLEKNNKEKRKITTLDKETYILKIQKFLLDYYFNNLQFPPYVTGFQFKKSYFDFLSIHRGEDRKFLKLDIQDFFGSIPINNLINDILNKFESDSNYKTKLKELLTLCLTYNDKLPQGYQTSPVLSNFYFLRADLRINKYCQKMGFKYSRYADDIIISTDNSKELNHKNLKVIERILEDFQLLLNKSKVKFFNKQLVINGFVIEQEIRLSQKKLSELRRILFIIEHKKVKNIEGIVSYINNDMNINGNNKKRIFNYKYLLNFLSGYRSFLIASIKNMDEKCEWYSKASKLILRIEHSLERLYNL